MSSFIKIVNTSMKQKQKQTDDSQQLFNLALIQYTWHGKFHLTEERCFFEKKTNS